MIVRNYNIIRFHDAQTTLEVAFDDLHAELDRVFVYRADIDKLHDALFARLLPYAACLRESVCRVPWKYASQALVTHAFSELFFARELHLDHLCVDGNEDFWGYAGNFVGLPCVQHSRLLGLGDPDLLLHIREQLVQWLCSGGPKKTFFVRIDLPTPPPYLRRAGTPSKSVSDYPSLDGINEHTGEAFSVKTENIPESSQDYVRVTYNRRPLSPLGS